jgi:hypothetical protein
LALWYRARTADSRVGTRKTMIVAGAGYPAGERNVRSGLPATCRPDGCQAPSLAREFPAATFPSDLIEVTAGVRTGLSPASQKPRCTTHACGHRSPLMGRFVADSLLEGKGFEPSVPRRAPGVVVASLLVRADFSVGGGSSRGDMSPLETLVVSGGTGGSKSCADPTSARGGGTHYDPAPGWPRDRLRCNLPPSA